MTSAPERGNATTQDTNSDITLVRDFAYDTPQNALSETISTAEDELNTSGSKSQDPNKLPYTTFYDAAWTISENQLKPFSAGAILPTPVLANYNILSAPEGSAFRVRCVSDKSVTSEYSQYLSSPPFPQNGSRGQWLPYPPMQTLLSDVEVQTTKDGGARENSEGTKAIVSVEQASHTKSGAGRHESGSTLASSKYSQYSTRWEG